jgi:hypothetical protein
MTEAAMAAPLLALALIVLLAACGAPAPTPTPVAPPTPGTTPGAPDEGRAEDTEPPFQLIFTLPRTTWSVDEEIHGEARLRLLQDGVIQLGGSSGGLIGYAFAEVGGRRQIEPAWTSDCAPHELAAGRPIVSSIVKSGGYSPDDPDADFYRRFLADPLVRLPAGDWEITAIASFIEGADCSGDSHALRATIRVRVEP